MKIPSKNKGGDCYEASGRQILDNQYKDKDLVLVHGIVTGQGAIEGIQFGHAWVEKGNTVIDKSNGRSIELPKAVYYALGKIKKTKRYTVAEAVKKMLDTGHFGPWDLKSEF
jgi:hypothetical protein